ncbi:unnamed protein product [Cuscuta epithymum]|uniref:DUF3615 domain-containing protein n=1 Tax=Cuscuta epithymum TaxID=186058 RepID=A0AAV0EE98_9ASTE|nr:unnamed protein product [Cuscuta epithymum]
MMAKTKRTSTLHEKTPKVSHMRKRGVGIRAKRPGSKPSTQKRLTKLQKEQMQWDEEFHKLSEFALRDYNDKHGTDLVLCSILRYETFGARRGYTVGFERRFTHWTHINFYARRIDADPSDKPLLLFAELYLGFDEDNKNVLARLSLVTPMGNESGCSRCPSPIIQHPSHEFHGGFMQNCLLKGVEGMESIGRTRSVQKTATKKRTHDISDLAKFALEDYNKKHGTKLEYVKAVERNSFSCMGLSMDFRERYTSWEHMNFVARRRKGDGSYEDLFLFAELYLGDGENKHVLATLSAVNENLTLNESGCLYCPNTIRHPGHHYLYCDVSCYKRCVWTKRNT